MKLLLLVSQRGLNPGLLFVEWALRRNEDIAFKKVSQGVVKILPPFCITVTHLTKKSFDCIPKEYFFSTEKRLLKVTIFYKKNAATALFKTLINEENYGYQNYNHNC